LAEVGLHIRPVGKFPISALSLEDAIAWKSWHLAQEITKLKVINNS